MADEEKVSAFRWAQFIFGALAFAALIYVHIFVKELEWWIIGIPGALLGIDPAKFLGGPRK